MYATYALEPKLEFFNQLSTTSLIATRPSTCPHFFYCQPNITRTFSHNFLSQISARLPGTKLFPFPNSNKDSHLYTTLIFNTTFKLCLWISSEKLPILNANTISISFNQLKTENWHFQFSQITRKCWSVMVGF